MVRRTLLVLGVVIGGIVAFAGLVLVAMLTKSPRLLDAVRWFNRAFTNRLQRPFAGKPGAYASVIRHQGRRSGRSYETPIVPFATDDGFVVSLPYGPTADWVRNVLAHGSAVLVHEGRTLTVDQPHVVPIAQVEDLFPPSEQRTHRLFRIEQCLRLRRVEVDSAGDGDELVGERPRSGVGGHSAGA
jgi:deazaflavin-dependent oxidoreductase (nitroreductase family)